MASADLDSVGRPSRGSSSRLADANAAPILAARARPRFRQSRRRRRPLQTRFASACSRARGRCRLSTRRSAVSSPRLVESGEAKGAFKKTAIASPRRLDPGAPRDRRRPRQARRVRRRAGPDRRRRRVRAGADAGAALARLGGARGGPTRRRSQRRSPRASLLAAYRFDRYKTATPTTRRRSPSELEIVGRRRTLAARSAETHDRGRGARTAPATSRTCPPTSLTPDCARRARRRDRAAETTASRPRCSGRDEIAELGDGRPAWPSPGLAPRSRG